jgi:predicted Zn-dependent protease
MALKLASSQTEKFELSHARVERLYLKLAVGSFIAIVLLIAAIWGGRKFYVRLQERQLTRRAVAALQQGDATTASLALRALLELKPSSVLAARMMADLAEKAGNRSALDWRRKVVQAEPDSIDDALALARSAVQFNDLSAAEKTLGRVNQTGRQRADYHAAAALLAQAQQRDKEADSEWNEAIRLAPEEKAYQLQFGTLRLRARDEGRHEAGRSILMALRSDPKERTAATRAIVNDGLSRGQDARSLLPLAHELQDYSDAILSDRLMYLHLLRQLNDPQFTGYLSELENRVAKNAVDLASLINWMSQNNLNLLALDFVKSLPRETLDQWPVPMTLADVYSRLNDWSKLEEIAALVKWGQYDFLRRAYLARAFRAEEKTVAAEREWSEAVKSASNMSESLLTLARLASEWSWDKEALDLLWQLSKNAETQGEALRTLYAYYTKKKDAQGLYRVLLRMFEMDPADTKVQNNLAQLSVLLEADLERARKMAAALYQREPSNAAFATTYAYSLYQKGDAKGALAVMSGLRPEQLREPEVAAYYGIFLSASGDQTKAREYLDLGSTANLLREEKALLKKAAENTKSATADH